MKTTIALLLLAVSAAPTALASDGDSTLIRPVEATYSIEAGSAHIADTYLTPLRYSGWQTTLRYSRLQATRFNPRRWVMQFDIAANVNRTLNPVRNARIWYWGIDFTAGLMSRVWNNGAGFSAMVGPDFNVNLGALYAQRNSNNPVSVKAAITAGLTGRLRYAFRLGRLQGAALWQPMIPVVGAFFSPDYGQLYYEIYLGERKNLARAAWFGNYFRLNNLIAADINLGKTILRLGYRLDYLSTSASHITSRSLTHMAVLGFTGQWISVNPRKTAVDPRFITPQ